MAKNEEVKPKKEAKFKKNDINKTFPIVGIGASAGGLEALEVFFANMPSDCGISFVVIQHLDPKRKSIMGTILERYTKMKVLEIKDRMKVKPNCIYLNPPNKNIEIINRTLYLAEPIESRRIRLPIDSFLRSLAMAQREKAICIILSGTGTDGTLGLKAVKGEGGITLVQEEEQAKYSGMPESAIDTGLVDCILPVEKMPGELLKYSRHPYIKGKPIPVTAPEQLKSCIEKIFMIIRSTTGHDFSNYKQSTIRRRLERRMALHQINRLQDYVRYLQQNRSEVETVAMDMLIGVTSFFRDPAAFEFLQQKVITALLANRQTDSPLRVWIPGCATGEEAYSTAILIAETLDKMKKPYTVQIFATDLDPDAIEAARLAVYPESIVADVTADRLKRFFMKNDNTFRIKKQIREMVIFAVQDVIKDSPFSKLDLIICRNVLIYMNQVLQKRIIPLFHYVLNHEGFLFLGSSEGIGEFTTLFHPVNAKWKIFKRKGIALARRPEIPMMPFFERGAEVQLEGGKKVLTPVSVNEVAKKLILENYAPPCAVINERHEVLYFHGNTSKYLSLPPGEPSFNILKMAHEDLRHKLSVLIHTAFKQRKTSINEGIQIKDNKVFMTIKLTVMPVKEPASGQNLVMVVFEDMTPPPKKSEMKKGKPPSAQKAGLRIQTLEQELQATREYLQTTIEELETSNEELRSTNEELQSTSEELQSTNEEMETSKEELQSINEELVIVNSDLQDKVNELSRANNDLHNLLSTTEIGIIFLDTALCIKRFTPIVTKLISLRQADIGRPISDITSNILHENLSRYAEEVLQTLHKKEIEIKTKDGDYYSMAILPYRTIDNVIDGVVFTFINITDTKRLTLGLQRLATVVSDSNDAVTVHDINGRISAWNKGAEKMYGYKEGEALTMNIDRIVPKEKRLEYLELLNQIKRGAPLESFETQRIAKDGRILDVWLKITKLIDDKGDVVSIATTEQDITDRKRRGEEYKKTIEDLQRQVEELRAS